VVVVDGVTTELVPNRYERSDDAASDEPLGRSFSVRLIALVLAISDAFDAPLLNNEPNRSSKGSQNDQKHSGDSAEVSPSSNDSPTVLANNLTQWISII